MKTKSIGELLREERQRHHVQLADLAKKTRIKQVYLEALENNQFEQLPAAIFVKGYIKTYARILGFDPQPLLALLRRDYKQSAMGTLIPREFIKPVLKKQALWSPVRIAVVAVITIFLVLFSYVGFQWYNLNKPPKLVIYSPKEDELVAAKVLVQGETSPEAIVAVNAQPVALRPDGTFEAEMYLPKEGIATITVEATDRRQKTSLVQRTVYVKF